MIFATRKIELDAGHRVTNHHSKCRNIHGHRYVVEMAITGTLQSHGSQQGMILDFGFMKDALMTLVHEPCDHALILWSGDPLLKSLPGLPDEIMNGERAGEVSLSLIEGKEVRTHWAGGALVIVPFVPTAENLAAYWGRLLVDEVNARTDGMAQLDCLTVWETPNCSAVWRP